MKIIFFLVLISLMLASCSSPVPVPTAVPTQPPTQPPPPTQTPVPTATATPTLTPTPEPTATPEPVAVPLVYSGWTDKAYSHVCVDSIFMDVSQNPIPGVTDVNVPGRMEKSAKALLATMGMQVVPVNETCEILYFINALALVEYKTTFEANGDVCIAYKKVELGSDLAIMAPPGGDGFTVHFTNATTIKEDVYFCNKFPEPPFDLVWPKVVIDSFVKVYGPAAIEAALKVPDLQAAAEAMK